MKWPLFLIVLYQLVFCYSVSSTSQTGWQSRINGGSPTPNFPFIVQVLANGRFVCTGTIVNPRWVLTAANCLRSDSGLANYNILAGTDALEDLNGGILYKATKIIPHPAYNIGTNDVGLIQLEKDMVLPGDKKTARISTNSIIPIGFILRTAGWGTTGMPSQLSSRWLQTELKVSGPDNCREYWPEITEKQICAYGFKNSAVCQADSGSPLLIDDTVIAIVSYGSNKCGLTDVGVYTNIAAYSNWIDEIMKKYNSIEQNNNNLRYQGAFRPSRQSLYDPSYQISYDLWNQNSDDQSNLIYYDPWNKNSFDSRNQISYDRWNRNSDEPWTQDYYNRRNPNSYDRRNQISYDPWNQNSYDPKKQNLFYMWNQNSYNPWTQNVYEPWTQNPYTPWNQNSYYPWNQNSYYPWNQNSYYAWKQNSYNPWNQVIYDQSYQNVYDPLWDNFYAVNQNTNDGSYRHVNGIYGLAYRGGSRGTSTTATEI